MADTRAAAYARRLAGLFAQSAATLSVSRGGVPHDVQCFFQVMDQGTIGIYFNGNEAVGLVHPALMVWTRNTEDIQVNDLFFYDTPNRPAGVFFVVRKVEFFRQGGTPLVMLALCD